jgi:hypothetical protein
VGWAGLSPKGLGRSRPNSPLCFCWSGPDPTQTSGLGQNRPDLEKKNRGGLFPPSHPPACRTVFVLHVGGDKAKNEVKAGGKKRYLAGGGGALLVWLRSWLMNRSSGRRCCCFKRWRERLLLYPCPLFSLLFFCYVSLFSCSSLSVFFFTSRSSSCFSLVPLTFLSQSLSLVSNFLVFFSSSLYRLLYFLFFLFSLLFSFFFSLFFFLCWRWVVFIGQRGAGASLSPPYRCAWGAVSSCPAMMPG